MLPRSNLGGRTRVARPRLDLGNLARTESIFALSNGHIGLRGNLDEGEPCALPGTYLNSFYELRPLPYAEAGYGYPEAGQTIVNVTNGKIIRLLVDDEPFDVRYGHLLAHERELDLSAGVLRRTVDWRSPAGTPVRVSSLRLVSFVQRAVAAILYEVEPLERAVRVVVQSELVANEPAPPQSDDPRAAAALEAPLCIGAGESRSRRRRARRRTGFSQGRRSSLPTTGGRSRSRPAGRRSRRFRPRRAGLPRHSPKDAPRCRAARLSLRPSDRRARRGRRVRSAGLRAPRRRTSAPGCRRRRSRCRARVPRSPPRRARSRGSPGR